MSASDWQPYDVPGLAELLSRQPTDAGSHASAWQYVYESLTDRRRALEAARAALAESWSPTENAAAQPFFAQIDTLTAAMSATADGAVESHAALTGIVAAMDTATTKIDRIHQSWQHTATSSGAVLPQDDWTTPLNEQAHAVMGEADAVIAEHAGQLTPPVMYQPPAGTSGYASRTIGTADGRIPGAAGTRSQQVGGSVDAPSMAAPGRADGSSPRITGSGSASLSQGEPRRAESSIVLTESGPTSTSANGPASASTDPPRSPTADSPESLVAVPELFHRSTPNGRVLPVGANNVGQSALGRSEAGEDQLKREVGSRLFTNVGSTTPTVVPDVHMGKDINGGPPSSHDLAKSSTTSAAADGFGMLPGATAVSESSAARRTQRGSELVDWQVPVGVPPVLFPVDERPIIHTPGPGVIGIDR